jgi:hypothetical protein
MAQTQFQKGMINIQRETTDSLRKRGIVDASILFIPQPDEANGATLSVTVHGKAASQFFTYGEIEDSGEAIDAPAAHKLRTLLSVFAISTTPLQGAR